MTDPSPQNIPKWVGPLFIVMGFLPMLIGEPSPGVPRWVAYLACSVFVIAGLAMTLQSLDIIWPSYFLGPLLIFIFATIASWIAFAPGERQCSGGLNFFGLSLKSVNSCTIPFGFSAVMCWAIFIFAVASNLKRWKKPKG